MTEAAQFAAPSRAAAGPSRSALTGKPGLSAPASPSVKHSKMHNRINRLARFNRRPAGGNNCLERK
jgi:hypothetical protein